MNGMGPNMIFLPSRHCADPDHIKAEVPHPTKMVLKCTDKHKLGLFFGDRQNHIKAKCVIKLYLTNGCLRSIAHRIFVV
ncbi:hypothetical protein BGW80DRAFT_1274403, partial [Lactifluus volemus]